MTKKDMIYQLQIAMVQSTNKVYDPPIKKTTLIQENSYQLSSKLIKLYPYT